MRTFTFIIGLILLFSSCNNARKMGLMKFENPENQFINIRATLSPFKENSKPFRIIDAYIDGNLLYLQIEYRKSCSGTDYFEFIGGDLFLNERDVESREARLFIKGSGESCSLISETKTIDIRPLASLEQRDAMVLLYIGGWRTNMIYVFVPFTD